MHWGRILRNIFSNWSSYLVTAVVGFALAPVVVHSLGDAGYGLWTIVLSLTGYFGLLDLGIRSSVGRFVARYLALSDETSVNRTATGAFAILSAGGLLAFAAAVVIAMFFFDAVAASPELRAVGRTALLITGLNMGLILPLGVFSSLLIAMERYDVVSGVTIVAELTRAALVVWILNNGYGLVGLALIALGITMAQYAAMAFFARRLYRPLRLGTRYLKWAACKELIGFGVYRFIWIVANQLIFYSDALVIALFLGAAAVTPYAIAGSLINYGRNAVSLVTDTLYPAAARMDAKDDRAGLQRLLILGTRLSLLVTLPVCLGLIFLGRHFIILWMGPQYASSAILLAVLTIPQFGGMSQSTSALVLAGMAKHRTFAYFALAEGIANVTLSVVLVQKMGLIGVAWGTVIPSLICTTILVPWYTLRVLQLDPVEYFAKAYLRPLACAVPLIAVGYAFSQVHAASWLLFVLEAGVMCAIFWIGSYFVCLDSGQRAMIAGRLGSIFQREAVVS